MSNINKKGMSSTIAVVLLLSLAIFLTMILYPVVRELIKTPAMSPELCKDIAIEQSISMTTSCYNPQTNNLEITLTKESKTALNSLLFEINFGNETNLYKCGSDCGNCKILGKGTKTYNFFPNRIPKTVTVIGNGCTLAASEIYPCKA